MKSYEQEEVRSRMSNQVHDWAKKEGKEKLKIERFCTIYINAINSLHYIHREFHCGSREKCDQKQNLDKLMFDSVI